MFLMLIMVTLDRLLPNLYPTLKSPQGGFLKLAIIDTYVLSMDF